MSDTAVEPAKNPAGKIALITIILLLLAVLIYTLTDRMAPSSSRGIVSAHVVQIAPRVPGEVLRVQVQDDAVVEAADPLFQIDPQPFELAMKQAEANLASTVQNIDASGPHWWPRRRP